MATRSDMLLMRALSQFGAGLGSHMSRRRQGKQDEEFANQMYPDTTPEEMMNPQDTQLIQALTGNTMPGMAGMISGAGMQGNQMMRASGQSEQANAQAQKMRGAMKDPRIAAMMKQGMAQAELAKNTTQPTKIMSVSDGFVVQSGENYEFVKTKKDTSKPSERYDTWNVGDKTYIVDLLTPDEDGNPTIVQEGSKGQLKLEEIGMGTGEDGESRKGLAIIDLATKQSTPVGSSYRAGESNVREMSVGEQKTRRTQLTETRDTLRDYSNIRELFKPEYLTLLGKGTTAGQGVLDKLGALDAFPDFFGKERFTDVKGFYSATQERANKYIKMITGAQMSEAEAKRLMKAIPSIEDSPNTFQAKLDYIVKVSQSSYDAYAFELASGSSLEEAKMAGNQVVNELMPDGVALDRILSGDFQPGGTPSFVGE